LGSNESLYGWMDEGFTSFAENHVMNWIRAQGLLVNEQPEADPLTSNVAGYCRFALSGREEPLSIHADHFQTNTAYSVASYVKGSVFLQQLKYIVGEPNFDIALLQYYNTWKFKHPNPNDVIRIFELQSNLELDWFKEYFVYTTLTIDYAVKSVQNDSITIARIGKMPMPLDIMVTYDDNSRELFYISLDLLRGEKPNEIADVKRTILPDWQWVNGSYSFKIGKKVKRVEIDPSGRMADVKKDNNVYEAD
jgi:aminopeptidase N